MGGKGGQAAPPHAKEHTMTATTAGTAGTHTFTASATDRTRCECGKSRNTSAHGYNAKARSAAQAGARVATAKVEKVTTETVESYGPDAVVVTREYDAESPADARARRAAELAEAVNAGTITFDAAAAELLSGKAEAYAAETTAPTPAEAAESDLYDAVRTADATAKTHEEAVAILSGRSYAERIAETRASEDAARERHAARTLREMAPEERAETVARAVAQLQEELTANADAIAAVLEEPLPGETAPVAEVKAPKVRELVSVWVGWRIADVLLARAEDTDPVVASIAAKVAASPQGKRLARTIRLTAAESAALTTITTEVEEAAADEATAVRGPLIDSARTLRDRITAAWA